ncbi:MAG: hypothetical protein U0Y10_01475 [Spirosomataceae bacterium]
MKNILLGIILLLSGRVMAQSLTDQYPILSKSTKFTKESPRYKGIPYDSAYLELKAGQRVWVSFDLRKAPLKVEIVRPSGQLVVM